MAPRRPPRQGKKAVSPVSRPKSPRVVLVRTETDENGEKDSATSARSRPRSRSNSVSKRGGGGRRGSGGSGKLASTSTASCYVTRNQQQSLFFPIQSASSPKDCLFNFSASKSSKSKPRKINKEASEPEPIDVKVDPENELILVRNPFHHQRQQEASTSTATTSSETVVFRPVQKVEPIMDPSTPTNDNDMDTTVELAPEVTIKTEDEDLVRLYIDKNETQFSNLINSDVTGNNITLSAAQLENCTSFMELKDNLNFRESNPGIGIASFDYFDNTITGYLHIAPKTLKPMSISQNVRIALWVLQGEVVLKSTQYESVNGNNTLVGKLLGCGSCIMVPPFTPYMLENRSPTVPVMIGYVMMSDEGTSGGGQGVE